MLRAAILLLLGLGLMVAKQEPGQQKQPHRDHSSSNSNSSSKAHLVSRIAFGSCANQSAPQVSVRVSLSLYISIYDY